MSDAGYRLTPVSGPRIRSDVVDVYVFQRSGRAPMNVYDSGPGRSTRMDSDGAEGFQARNELYFLQLLRVGAPLADTWHPVMGHCESGETAVACMRRELLEEIGLETSSPAIKGVWALEQVHPFYIVELDAIVMSPRFAAEVEPGWEPTLNEEHSAYRWVHSRDLGAAFMWPGQKAACREITEHLLPDGSLMRDLVEIKRSGRPTGADPKKPG